LKNSRARLVFANATVPALLFLTSCAVPLGPGFNTERQSYEVRLVTEEATPDGRKVLVVQTEGASFSSADHGADLFRNVAAFIYEARQRKSKNPIFIGDCVLPSSFREKFCPQGAKGTHYLAYRKLIEGKLYQALQAL